MPGGDGFRPSLSAEQLVGAVPQLEGASLTVRTLRSARPWP